jgi:predicted enzyme related to lactoylglutathione lyase
MLLLMAEASIGLVLDCAEPEVLADFWSSALGMVKLGSAGNYVLLFSPSGTLPKLLLQRVGEPKAGKNRMHLDIEVREVETEVSRLEAIGAHRSESEPRTEHGTTWVIMVDPEGNEFCVCDGGQGAAI